MVQYFAVLFHLLITHNITVQVATLDTKNKKYGKFARPDDLVGSLLLANNMDERHHQTTQLLQLKEAQLVWRQDADSGTVGLADSGTC